jgi:hypothetical protein
VIAGPQINERQERMMKTLVVYYSLTGFTRTLAGSIALERLADLAEIQEVRQRTVLGAFVFGAFQAMRSRPSSIVPMKQDFGSYDRIVLASPIWAGSVVPATVAFIRSFLPPGKDVEVILCSGGGDSGRVREQIGKMIGSAGSRLVAFQDVKAEPRKRKSS